MSDDRHERGMQIRREVLGDEHVDAAIARATAFNTEFQGLITRYAWGEIWARPGLHRRTPQRHRPHSARGRGPH